MTEAEERTPRFEWRIERQMSSLEEALKIDLK